LHHHRRTDITGTVDASSAGADKGKTVGPDDKGGTGDDQGKFDLKLGLSTTDLGQVTSAALARPDKADVTPTPGAADKVPDEDGDP
jgi:hypothetical protein